jgi:hypothetical protein
MHWGWYVGGGLLATGVVITGIALALDDGPGEPAAGKAKVDHASERRSEKMEKPPERADDGKPTGDGSGNDGGSAAPAAGAGTPDGGGGKAA